MKKKKSDNRFLCYIGIFFLAFLMLLPPALRIFAKNLYVKVEEKKDEIVVISCNKLNESISSSFLNNEPQNIEYTIKGNYSVKNEMENEDPLKNDNIMIDLIRKSSQITYDEVNDKTVFKVKTTNLSGHKDYISLFSSITNQQNFFSTQAFSCEKSNYELPA